MFQICRSGLSVADRSSIYSAFSTAIGLRVPIQLFQYTYCFLCHFVLQLKGRGDSLRQTKIILPCDVIFNFNIFVIMCSIILLSLITCGVHKKIDTALMRPYTVRSFVNYLISNLLTSHNLIRIGFPPILGLLERFVLHFEVLLLVNIVFWFRTVNYAGYTRLFLRAC